MHEQAHRREAEHNQALYQLCAYRLSGYRQLEFDLRVYPIRHELPRY